MGWVSLSTQVPLWLDEIGMARWINEKDSNDIERIQKLSIKIILKGCYSDYTEAYLYFDTTTLKQNREKRCICFVRKKLKKQTVFFYPDYPVQ